MNRDARVRLTGIVLGTILLVLLSLTILVMKGGSVGFWGVVCSTFAVVAMACRLVPALKATRFGRFFSSRIMEVLTILGLVMCFLILERALPMAEQQRGKPVGVVATFPLEAEASSPGFMQQVWSIVEGNLLWGVVFSVVAMLLTEGAFRAADWNVLPWSESSSPAHHAPPDSGGADAESDTVNFPGLMDEMRGSDPPRTDPTT